MRYFKDDYILPNSYIERIYQESSSSLLFKEIKIAF